MRILLLSLRIALPMATVVHAQEVPSNRPIPATREAIKAELDEPVIIRSRVGRDFQGKVGTATDNTLSLATQIGGGSVEYTFIKDDILSLHLPGNRLKSSAIELAENGDSTTALLIIDLLFEQRAPLFRFLPESEPVFFAETLPFYRQSGRVEDSLIRAEQIVPFLSDPASIERLEEEILLGHFELGHDDQAVQLAKDWIDRQPLEPDSALGWYVLGNVQSRTEKEDTAFFTYLQPIVFSSPVSMPFLNRCYAEAIATAAKLDRLGAADALLNEMQDRKIAWPENMPPIDFSTANPTEN